jgi:hypothetical protein
MPGRKTDTLWQQRVAGAILPVCDACGFLVTARFQPSLDDEPYEEVFILTAAHCLPQLPDAAVQEEGYVTVGPHRTLAHVVFADPCADVAVLDAPDDQQRPEEAEAFNELVATLPALSLRLDIPPFLHREHAHILTHERTWLTAIAEFVGFYQRSLFLTLEDKNARIPAGTSGSPIFDDHARVIGVVSIASMTDASCHGAFAAHALPTWLVNAIREVAVRQ